MKLSRRESRRRREADLNLGVGGDLDWLLALLQAVEVELDGATGGRALRPDAGPDLDRFSLGHGPLRRLRRFDRDVPDLLGGQADDECRHLGILPRLDLGDLVQALGRPLGVPRTSRQVRQDMDEVDRPVATGDGLVGLAHRDVERPADRVGRQALDPLEGRGRRQAGHPGLERIDDEDQARIRELGDDITGPLLGLFQPGLVLILVFHGQAGVDDEAQGRRHRLVAQRDLRVDRRAGEGQGHQREHRHPRQQEQPVLDLQPFLRPPLPLADEPDGREHQMLRRLLHEQVEDHRQGGQG